MTRDMRLAEGTTTRYLADYVVNASAHNWTNNECPLHAGKQPGARAPQIHGAQPSNSVCREREQLGFSQPVGRRSKTKAKGGRRETHEPCC